MNELPVADIDADVINSSWLRYAEEDEIAFFQVALGHIDPLLALRLRAPLQFDALFAEYIFRKGRAVKPQFGGIVDSKFVSYFAFKLLG